MSGIGPKTVNTYTSIAPPTNYVAGVGRGAMGFTTRSDIGPARPLPLPIGVTPIDPQFGQAPAGYVAGMGRGMGELARGQGEVNQKNVQEERDRGDYSESNYDEFSGYGEKLFSAGTPYEEDDAEADKIYDEVDGAMDSRRKRFREKKILDEQKRAKFERPRIADQFADLKRELSSVTSEQWENIPDVGDHSLKLKQNRKKDMFTPVPDYLIEGQSNRNSLLNSVDASGLMTPKKVDGITSTLSGLAEARGNELSNKLDRMSDSVSGQTVVDPKGYLTHLNSLKVTSDAEIGDIKKARILLSSVTTTNPKHGPGWIAAARVEEFAGKSAQARKIILQGCETCPESEDVWLEAARLHNTEKAKTILANAVLHLPTSVKIWLKAADLEEDENNKKAVFRRSLEFVPNSVKLWKAAIELENVTDARIMLARAVECVPNSVEMWLALAKLETHENARKVLNQAREAIPTEKATWITAAKLEEANGNVHLVPRIVEKMLLSLSQYQVTIDREQWLKEAEDCEHAGAIRTCQSIIRNTLHLGVEEEDRKNTWMDDAENCLSHSPPSTETARAIYNVAFETFPNKKKIWLAAAMLEKEFGTAESLETKLKEAVRLCPQAEVLWLMAAKEKWLAGNISAARAILVEAFDANPQAEQIWLAAVKLEWENNEVVRARLLLSKARERASSERVWMKSALLECEVGDTKQELQLLDEAIQLFPSFFKFYLMAGQTCDRVLNDPIKARQYYMQGLKHCPQCVQLWVHLIKLEEKVKGVVKARPTGEMARMKLPKNDVLWLECIRLERRAGNDKLAENLMAQALIDCPSSGRLWSELIMTCPKSQKKSKTLDALKKCDKDPHVLMTIARLFEKENKTVKARKWFERAVLISPRFGDAWIYYYAFEYVLVAKRHLILFPDSSHSASWQSIISAAHSLERSVQFGTTEAGHGSKANAVSGGVQEKGNDTALLFDDDEDDGVELDELEKFKDEILPAKESAGLIESKQSDSNNQPSLSSEQTLREYLSSLDLVEKRCIQSQPNTGELWCSISKETKLRRQAVGTILRIAAVERVLGVQLTDLSIT